MPFRSPPSAGRLDPLERKLIERFASAFFSEVTFGVDQDGRQSAKFSLESEEIRLTCISGHVMAQDARGRKLAEAEDVTLTLAALLEHCPGQRLDARLS